jgi:phosphoribosylformimino-5-aminoimidazole carboxamide ribotide isomerase
MIIFPAIDLKGGQVVRLAEGDMDRATVYGDNPAAQAQIFADQGSQYLHVVDLDGSFAGRAENRDAVEGILKTFTGHVQLGGGIRTREAVSGWFDLGVSRVVMGTAALKDPQFVKDMAKEFPGGIVVAVDARDGFVATEGWAEVSDVSVVDLARRFEDAGVASLLFTDIGRDGLLKGANIEATVDLARRVDIPVIASGGVKGLDDIRLLSLHAHEGSRASSPARAVRGAAGSGGCYRDGVEGRVKGKAGCYTPAPLLSAWAPVFGRSASAAGIKPLRGGEFIREGGAKPPLRRKTFLGSGV